MNDRLKIDKKVKEKSTDFYYSATDMYGINLFTDEFINKRELIETGKDEKAMLLASEMFTGKAQKEANYEFATEMFMTKQYERKYKESNEANTVMLGILVGVLAGSVSLGICLLLTKIVKRKEK